MAAARGWAPAELAEAIVGGLFEVTLGAKSSAAPEGIPLMYKAAAAVFILSWGGLSVHAQVASILNSSDLRYLPFLFARFLHGLVAAALLLLIWEPVMGAAPAFGLFSPAEAARLPGWRSVPAAFRLALALVLTLIILSVLSRIIHRWLAKPKKYLS
ncbi:hypothetical protein HMSSN036_91060 [Paenibacillus macerans]|nr:hypothetical protein HMSSN036_91060 [Paenibacillus macerans]